jgi:hypothetical protein
VYRTEISEMRTWGSVALLVLLVLVATALAWRSRAEPVRCSNVDTTFDYAAGTTTFDTREEAVENAVSSTLDGDLGDFTLGAAGPERYVVHWEDEDPANPLVVGVRHAGDGFLPTGVSC